VPAFTVRGTVRVPGDKSLSHRALIFSALSDGTARIRDILRSADVHSTATVLRALGVHVDPLGDVTTVTGRGVRGLQPPTATLDCGNSGTTTRLMAGVVAGHPFTARFEGDASLSKRPMRRVADPLTQMGATFEFPNGEGLPMIIHGRDLQPIHWHSKSASAQVKSAILLAGLVAQVPVTVTEPERSRDHTERFLSALGADVIVDGTTVSLPVVRKLAPVDITVPGDPSSAAFFAALAAFATDAELRLTNVSLNPTRTGFFDALQRMGAKVHYEDEILQAGEPVGTIVVANGALRAISITGEQVPSLVDELPMLACLATRAEGQTLITGAAELRVKESDRIATVVQNLRTLGAAAEELPDGMSITGTDVPLKGRVQTHGDHRIAMAFGILAACPGNDIEIDDPSCASVSYPAFWTDLARVVA
jgi:3-phosphoshikimate 1-carboxyvinyltransferase